MDWGTLPQPMAPRNICSNDEAAFRFLHVDAKYYLTTAITRYLLRQYRDGIKASCSTMLIFQYHGL